MEPEVGLLQSGMDETTEAVWRAMRAAYKYGLMDEMLGLAGTLMPPGMDQIEMLGDAEESLMQTDLAKVAGMLDGTLVPLARAMAEEEVVEAMKNLLLTFKPLIEGVVAASGGDATVIRDRLQGVQENLLALRPVAQAALPAFFQAASPHMEEFLRDKAGPAVGGAINAQTASLNRLVETNPRAIPAFLEGVSATVDAAEIRKAASALLPVLIAHRPKPLKWLAQEIAMRVKQRFGPARGGDRR